MIKDLSILIPTYNNVCIELVKSLYKQASEISNNNENSFEYEIIVGDDGSTNKKTIEENEDINNIPNCRYITREHNEGRSAIRNFLARQAKYSYLLFIDSDMVVRNKSYLDNYIHAENSDVIYGGYRINGNYEILKNNLRYIYESKNKRNGNASERRKNPYSDFHTSNFIVRRALMLEYPLDERFRKYGYEDVLWGKKIRLKGIKINHVENSLSFEKFESNTDFIAKTEEGMNTLFQFKDELKGYSIIINYAEKLDEFHLKGIVSMLFSLIRKLLKRKLSGNKPSVFLFNIYKLGFYCSLTNNA